MKIYEVNKSYNLPILCLYGFSEVKGKRKMRPCQIFYYYYIYIIMTFYHKNPKKEYMELAG